MTREPDGAVEAAAPLGPMMHDAGGKIPTRAELRALIRRVWITCGVVAIVICVAASGSIMAAVYAGYEFQKVLEVATVIFWTVVLTYGAGFFVPAFITSLLTISVGVHMNRKGLEVGEKTANHIDKLQEQLLKMVDDAREVIKPIREFANDLKGQPAKIADYIEKLEKEGTLEQIAKSMTDVGQKVKEVFEEAKKKAVDDEVDKI